MDANFLVRAALTLCLLVAITRAGSATSSRRAGCVLLAIGGACSGLLAFFSADVAGAGRPQASATTVHGSIHLALASIGFATALAGVIVLTGWLRGVVSANRAASAATVLAVITVVGMLATVITLRVRPGAFALSERVFIAAILAWTLVVAVYLRNPIR
jgi:hypothetical membrane protein